MEAEFQRARRPEQISARREAILAAAGELFDAEGPTGAGLNAIAARAGFTKSNVYRYFESREAVLLSLYVEEAEGLVLGLERGLGAVAEGDMEAVARAMTAEFLARPRLCRLLGIVAAVLEETVSAEAIIPTKRATSLHLARLAVAMRRVLPHFSAEDCGFAFSMIALFVGGLWPAANPAAAARSVLAMEEFCTLRLDAERDLTRGVAVILRGMTASQAV